MEITWLGRNCFRLRGREGVVITDPCPPESGYKPGKQQADIVTVSRKDEAGYRATGIVTGEPMVLDAPGEYEIGGILVTGVATKSPDNERNVVFIVEVDGVRVGHLGLLGAAPSARIMEQLQDIDVLLLPVGAGNALAPAVAQDVMTTIDPSIAIPMNYRTEQEQLELEPLEKFLKETGGKNEPQPKLTVTKSSLPAELSVVILEPKAS